MGPLFKIITMILFITLIENNHASHVPDKDLPNFHKSVLHANKLPFVILKKAPDGTIKMISEDTPKAIEQRAIESLRIEAKSGAIASNLRLVNQLLFPTRIECSEAMKREAFAVLNSLEHTNNKFALFNLAHCLLYGTGVEQTEATYARGILLLRNSQSQDYMPAKILLACNLYHKLVGKADFVSQIEALKIFFEAAEQGSDFSMLFIGHQFIDQINKEERDAKNAIIYFKRVKDKRLVSAILSALYLSQNNPEMALESAVEAKALYDNGRTTIPVSSEYIEYLQQKIARNNATVKHVRLKNKGNKSKNELAHKQFVENLEKDLRYIKHQYDSLKKYLMTLSKDTRFPVDADFIPAVWLTELMVVYKEFENAWIKCKDMDESRLCLDAFTADFVPLAENFYIGEQFVRSKCIPTILANNLRNIVFHSNF